jgi:hypothetical protein
MMNFNLYKKLISYVFTSTKYRKLIHFTSNSKDATFRVLHLPFMIIYGDPRKDTIFVIACIDFYSSMWVNRTWMQIFVALWTYRCKIILLIHLSIRIKSFYHRNLIELCRTFRYLQKQICGLTYGLYSNSFVF